MSLTKPLGMVDRSAEGGKAEALLACLRDLRLAGRYGSRNGPRRKITVTVQLSPTWFWITCTHTAVSASLWRPIFNGQDSLVPGQDAWRRLRFWGWGARQTSRSQHPSYTTPTLQLKKFRCAKESSQQETAGQCLICSVNTQQPCRGAGQARGWPIGPEQVLRSDVSVQLYIPLPGKKQPESADMGSCTSKPYPDSRSDSDVGASDQRTKGHSTRASAASTTAFELIQVRADGALGRRRTRPPNQHQAR
ncbi:hypothetical protein B0H66DRAFT_163896 [Apodospora peruviana]|uniref:Uncharacterized protein n=1 Tax=Apodospora peruviana TaxID=516989 RepID=A0AAE0IKP6_9PEZI|nr:hypothetical protein B0H66DRAFT_163896 [Apodospora peruviana]